MDFGAVSADFGAAPSNFGTVAMPPSAQAPPLPVSTNGNTALFSPQPIGARLPLLGSAARQRAQTPPALGQWVPSARGSANGRRQLSPRARPPGDLSEARYYGPALHEGSANGKWALNLRADRQKEQPIDSRKARGAALVTIGRQAASARPFPVTVPNRHSRGAEGGAKPQLLPMSDRLTASPTLLPNERSVCKAASSGSSATEPIPAPRGARSAGGPIGPPVTAREGSASQWRPALQRGAGRGGEEEGDGGHFEPSPQRPSMGAGRRRWT